MSDVEKIRGWLDEWSPAWNQVEPESQLLSMCRILLDACEFYGNEDNWVRDSDDGAVISTWDTFDCTRAGQETFDIAEKALSQCIKVIE